MSNKVIKRYPSFILGQCKCDCRTSIKIRTNGGYLQTFEFNHHNRGKLSPNYKGASTSGNGYLYVIRRHHPNADKRGRVFQHRYFMELDLGRYLTDNEVVHHLNKDTKNNEKYNIELIENNGKHLADRHNRIDTSDRFCKNDPTHETILNKYGTKRWLWDIDGYLCSKCYEKRRWQETKMKRLNRTNVGLVSQ